MELRREGPGSAPVRIAVAYVLFSGAWIFASDWLLGLVVDDPSQLTLLQSVKGFAFVGASGVLVWALVRREQRRLARTNEDLERAMEHAGILHRLLRHNLRNSCDVIRNNLDLLQSGRGDADRCRERIARQSADLATIAQKSQHLRDVVFDEDLCPVEQNLAAVLAEARASVERTHPDATFEVACPPGLFVVAHPRLAVAFRELLTNAVAHDEGGGTGPVSVRARAVDGRAEVSIADDGPGLPAIERVVLERGEEDALTHSTGIGLWLVRFIVADSDGDLHVETDEASGTVVSVSLPRPAAGRG